MTEAEDIILEMVESCVSSHRAYEILVRSFVETYDEALEVIRGDSSTAHQLVAITKLLDQTRAALIESTDYAREAITRLESARLTSVDRVMELREKLKSIR